MVAGQVDMEASQTREYCVAKNATLRAARPDSSRRKERLFGMTIHLSAGASDQWPGFRIQDSGFRSQESGTPEPRLPTLDPDLSLCGG